MDETTCLQLARAVVDFAFAALELDGWRSGILLSNIDDPKSCHIDRVWSPLCVGESHTSRQHVQLIYNLNQLREACAVECRKDAQLILDAAAKSQSISFPCFSVCNDILNITFITWRLAPKHIGVAGAGDVIDAVAACLDAVLRELQKSGWRFTHVLHRQPSDKPDEPWREILLAPETPMFDPNVPLKPFIAAENLDKLAQDADYMQFVLATHRERMLKIAERSLAIAVPQIGWDGGFLAVSMDHQPKLP